MSKGINRRDFLKAATATSTVLLGGDILSSRSLGQEAVKIPEAEKITITVITDNYYDALRPDYKIAKRYIPPLNAYISKAFLHAEHGLAYHVETVIDDESHNFLFDYGLDFQGVKRNVELLGIDFAKLEALGLSHDHMDHAKRCQLKYCERRNSQLWKSARESENVVGLSAATMACAITANWIN